MTSRSEGAGNWGIGAGGQQRFSHIAEGAVAVDLHPAPHSRLDVQLKEGVALEADGWGAGDRGALPHRLHGEDEGVVHHSPGGGREGRHRAQRGCKTSCDLYNIAFFFLNQYWKFETNIPRKGIARPQSQFPHSCVCERFIYSHDGFAFSVAGNMWNDPRNIYIAHRYMNVERGMWLRSSQKGIHKWDFFAVESKSAESETGFNRLLILCKDNMDT